MTDCNKKERKKDVYNCFVRVSLGQNNLVSNLKNLLNYIMYTINKIASCMYTSIMQKLIYFKTKNGII